jgi:hypothetical protein
VQEEIESVKEAYADMIDNLQEQVDDYSTADKAEEWMDRANKIDWSDFEDLEEEDDEPEDDSYEDLIERALRENGYVRSDEKVYTDITGN